MTTDTSTLDEAWGIWWVGMTTGWLHVASVFHDNSCVRWKWGLTVKKTEHWLPHGHWQLQYNYLSSSNTISGWLASKACSKQTFVDFIVYLLFSSSLQWSRYAANSWGSRATPPLKEQPAMNPFSESILATACRQFQVLQTHWKTNTEYLCGQYGYKCIRQLGPGLKNF